MTSVVRSQTSAEGSLYELVARGVKDEHFQHDSKDAVHPFDWRYDRWPASLPEERWTVPLYPAKFGARCEFEFDLPGDVLLEAALVIDLPSWLPPEMVEQNQTSDTYLTSDYSTVYGYTNGIAYYLFERIEIYQNKILLQELSGDALYAVHTTKSSWNQGLLDEKLAGIHDGSRLEIQRNATPGRLEIRLPMIGCSWQGDRGLPLAGLRDQPFRLRLTLRPLEKLVESTSSQSRPAPWGKSFTQIRAAPLEPITVNALDRDSIKHPTLFLRTRQLYLTNKDKDELAKTTIEIPYLRYFENQFGINQLDYAAIDRGGVSALTKILDARYTVERVVTFFRNQKDIAMNRLWQYTNQHVSDGFYYSNLQLTIAGQVREGPWTPDIWSLVIPDAKEERSSIPGISILNWSRGWRIEDMPPAIREPTGGINFSTADRPTLLITLNDIEKDPELNYKQSFLTAICESWALYIVQNGRGELVYAN